MDRDRLVQALSALGAVLRRRRRRHEVVAAGGGGLMLLGAIQRPTRDLDVIALVEGGRIARLGPSRPTSPRPAETSARRSASGATGSTLARPTCSTSACHLDSTRA